MIEKLLPVLADAANAINAVYYADHQTGETTTIAADRKADGSPVTKADLRSNEILIAGIRAFSSYPILSEETAGQVHEGTYWVIDPLDGTKGFIEKDGNFAIHVALIKDHEPVMGVVYMPLQHTCYFARKGEGAYRQDRAGQPVRIQVTPPRPLHNFRAMLSKHHLLPEEESFIRSLGITDIRQSGGLGLKCVRIAEGTADIYAIRDGRSIWDVAPGYVILIEAGGMMCDWHGDPLVFSKQRLTRGIIATNGQHGAIIDAALRQHD